MAFFSNDGGKISVRDEETFIDEFDFFDSFLEKQNYFESRNLIGRDDVC